MFRTKKLSIDTVVTAVQTAPNALIAGLLTRQPVLRYQPTIFTLEEFGDYLEIPRTALEQNAQHLEEAGVLQWKRGWVGKTGYQVRIPASASPWKPTPVFGSDPLLEMETTNAAYVETLVRTLAGQLTISWENVALIEITSRQSELMLETLRRKLTDAKVITKTKNIGAFQPAIVGYINVEQPANSCEQDLIVRAGAGVLSVAVENPMYSVKVRPLPFSRQQEVYETTRKLQEAIDTASRSTLFT